MSLYNFYQVPYLLTSCVPVFKEVYSNICRKKSVNVTDSIHFCVRIHTDTQI